MTASEKALVQIAESDVAQARVALTRAERNLQSLLSEMPTTGSKVAVCVGHSRSGDSGAVSVAGVKEWSYNLEVAYLTADALQRSGASAVVVKEYDGSSYGAAMSWLASHLRGLGVDAAIELHFNSASETAQGFEYLYYHSSSRGKALAQSLHAEHKRAFPFAVDRGIKARGAGDRGVQFLKLTHCPAVICEPFFGSSREEWNLYESEKVKLAEVYSRALVAFLRTN